MATKKHISKSTMVLKRFTIRSIKDFEEMYGNPQPLIGYCSTSHTLKFQTKGDSKVYYGTVASINPIRTNTSGKEVLNDYEITFCPMWAEKGPDYTPKTCLLSEIEYGVEVEYVSFEEKKGKADNKGNVYTFRFKEKKFSFGSEDFVKVLYSLDTGRKCSVFGYISDVSIDGILTISVTDAHRGMYSTYEIEVPEDSLIGVFMFVPTFSPFVFKDQKLVGPIPKEKEEIEETPQEEPVESREVREAQKYGAFVGETDHPEEDCVDDSNEEVTVDPIE